MSSLHRALFHTATKPCPACGEPTFRHAFTGATDEACALLGVQPDAEVCTGCADRAEQDLDDAANALALDEDPAFAEVCDARHAGYLAHAMEHQGAAAQESDRLATATITALARSGVKCAEGYSSDGYYRVKIDGFNRIGIDPARVVLAAAFEAGRDDHPAVVALAQRLDVEHRGGCLVPARAEVVPCGAGLDAHVEPVPGCTRGRVVATLRERATGRMAHPLAFAEGATRDEAVRAAVEALRAALAAVLAGKAVSL